MNVVLDAGACIAYERGDRTVAAMLEVARRDGAVIVTPAGVVAQVWRDGARQARLARLLAAPQMTVEGLDGPLARAAGVLCGRSDTSDVVDASVVLAARRHEAVVISSDRADLDHLDPHIRIVDC